jgi:hypothetical protein
MRSMQFDVCFKYRHTWPAAYVLQGCTMADDARAACLHQAKEQQMEELSAGQASVLVRRAASSAAELACGRPIQRCSWLQLDAKLRWCAGTGFQCVSHRCHGCCLPLICRNEQEIDKAMAEMEELEEQLTDSIRLMTDVAHITACCLCTLPTLLILRLNFPCQLYWG